MSKQDIEFEFEWNYLQRSVATVIEQFGLEGTLKGYLVQAPAMSRDWIRLLRAPSLTSSVSRDGASISSVCVLPAALFWYSIRFSLITGGNGFIHHSITHSRVENNECGVSFVFHIIITKSTKHLLLVLPPQSPKWLLRKIAEKSN